MSQEPSIASQRIGFHTIGFIFILGCLSAFGPLTIDMYLPGLPILTSDLQTSTSFAQLSLTACLIGLAVGQIVIGPFSDIKGRKKPLVTSLMIYFVASLLCVFVQSIWLLIIFRFIQGLSGAAGMVIARASLRDVFSGAELTKYFSMLMLVSGLAPILAPVVGGQLLEVMSWRGVFGVLASIGFIMFWSVLIGFKETLPIEKRKSGGIKAVLSTFRELIKDKMFLGFMLIQSFVMGGLFAYISGSSFVLQDMYNLSPQSFSFVFALNGVGLIIATQATGRLAGKVSLHKLLKVGLGMAIIGSALLLVGAIVVAPVPYISAMLFVTIASVGVINTSVFPLAMESQGNQAGSASALLGLFPFLVGAVVAPIVGIGNAAISMSVVIVIFECLAVVAYVLLAKK